MGGRPAAARGLELALLSAVKLARERGESVGVFPAGEAWRLGEASSELSHYRVHPSGRVFLCEGGFEMTVARAVGAKFVTITAPPGVLEMLKSVGGMIEGDG
jgi:hypothetical protein